MFACLFANVVGVWMGVYFIFIFISVKMEIGKMIHVYCRIAAVTRAWPAHKNRDDLNAAECWTSEPSITYTLDNRIGDLIQPKAIELFCVQ